MLALDFFSLRLSLFCFSCFGGTDGKKSRTVCWSYAYWSLRSERKLSVIFLFEGLSSDHRNELIIESVIVFGVVWFTVTEEITGTWFVSSLINAYWNLQLKCTKAPLLLRILLLLRPLCHRRRSSSRSFKQTMFMLPSIIHQSLLQSNPCRYLSHWLSMVTRLTRIQSPLQNR